MFQLPSHGDHVLLFKAISILIEERLSSDALVKAQQEKKAAQTHDKGELIPLAKVDLGFSISGKNIVWTKYYVLCSRKVL